VSKRKVLNKTGSKPIKISYGNKSLDADSKPLAKI